MASLQNVKNYKHLSTANIREGRIWGREVWNEIEALASTLRPRRFLSERSIPKALLSPFSSVYTFSQYLFIACTWLAKNGERSRTRVCMLSGIQKIWVIILNLSLANMDWLLILFTLSYTLFLHLSMKELKSNMKGLLCYKRNTSLLGFNNKITWLPAFTEPAFCIEKQLRKQSFTYHKLSQNNFMAVQQRTTEDLWCAICELTISQGQVGVKNMSTLKWIRHYKV